MQRAFLSSMLAGGLACLVLELPSIVRPALAGDVHVAPVTAYVEANVRAWIEDPLIVETLKDSNARCAHYTVDDLLRLDTAWRSQILLEERPLVQSVTDNPLSSVLRRWQASSDGVITEIIVMDAKGLSVGESEVSSDYWQGDEPKWRNTYLAGSDALFVDAPEKDESTQLLQSQASLAVFDPKTGQPIGAITVGINLDAL